VNEKSRSVEFEIDGNREAVEARFLLVNFGRNVLGKYAGRPYQPDATDEGSVFKINMLLRRLPKLKATRYPAAEAFCGTFHSSEGYQEMRVSYEQAAQGHLPEKLPCEVYCHTLTDDSILAPELRSQGFQTMTLFGIDTPWRLFAHDNDAMRQEAERGFLESMNQWLAEPLEDCLAVARNGDLCIESKTPVDIEDALEALVAAAVEQRAQLGEPGAPAGDELNDQHNERDSSACSLGTVPDSP
jgi:phytoene dehydrogenase-like protein